MPGARYTHEVGAQIGDKYRVTGRLGRGGMGVVYEAINDAVGKRVAIKVLSADLAEHPEFARRFELEARAGALINHPGVVDVLDFGSTGEGEPYIVMEYLQGVTLRELLSSLKVLSPGQASAVVAPVLDALAAAHAAGVIHRDLKPANIFLSVRPQARVKILDFGISKFHSELTGMTMTGATLGTPAFMPPEQLKDGRDVGPHSDLYAIGAVLYQALVGRPPFEADGEYALVAKVLSSHHLPACLANPAIPPKLGALVDRLLSKDPALRPHDARAAARELLALAPADARSVLEAANRIAPPARSSSSPAVPRQETPARKGQSRATPHRAGSASGPVPQPTRAEREASTPGQAGPVPEPALPRDTQPGAGRRPRLLLVVSGLLALAGVGAAVTVTVMDRWGEPPALEPELEPEEPMLNPAAEPLPTAVPALVAAEAPPPAEAPGAGSDADAGSASPDAGARAAVAASGKPGKPGKKGKFGKVVVVEQGGGPNSSPFQVAAAAPDDGEPEPEDKKRSYAEAVRVADEEMAAIRRMSKSSAEREVESAVKRALASGDQLALGFAWRNAGNYLQDRGACAEAVEAFSAGISVFEKAKVFAGAGMLANDVGMMGHACTGVDRLEWFKKSVGYRWKANDLAGVRKSANNLGNEYAERKNYEEADKSYGEALMAATALKDYPGVVKVHANLARIWTELASGGTVGSKPARDLTALRSTSWVKAKKHYEEGMAVARRHNFNFMSFCVAWPVEYHGYCADVLETLGLK